MSFTSFNIQKSRVEAALAKHKLLQILPGERIDANIIEQSWKFLPTDTENKEMLRAARTNFWTLGLRAATKVCLSFFL